MYACIEGLKDQTQSPAHSLPLSPLLLFIFRQGLIKLFSCAQGGFELVILQPQPP